MPGFQHVFDANSERTLLVEAARLKFDKAGSVLLSSCVLGSIPPIVVEIRSFDARPGACVAHCQERLDLGANRDVRELAG